MKTSQKVIVGCVVGLLIIAAVFFYVMQKKHVQSVPQPQSETPVPEPIVAPKEITYTTLTIGTNPRKEIEAAVGKENVPLVLALNRINMEKIQKDAVLTVPENWEGVDMMALSPFPLHALAATDIPKLIVVSQEMQALGLYENGKLVRWAPVSSGKKATPTPSKLYFTNWKAKVAISNFDESWIMPWNFNIDNFEGISLHQYELPGYAASHSCVRLFEADAMFIYDWADQWKVSDDGERILQYGTPVIVYGAYGFGKPGPWKSLPKNPTAAIVSDAELNEQLVKYLPEIENKLHIGNASDEAGT